MGAGASSRSEAPAAVTHVRVCVPPGMTPGTLAVFNFDGRLMRARIPEGLTPGMLFDVRLPEPRLAPTQQQQEQEQQQRRRQEEQQPALPAGRSAAETEEFHALLSTQLSAISAVKEAVGADRYSDAVVVLALQAHGYALEPTIAALLERDDCKAAKSDACCDDDFAELHERSLDAARRRRESELARFSLAELSAATDGFSATRKLGQGGFGSVFRADLPAHGAVAVKRLDADSQQGFKEFEAEVSFLARLRHPNLVRLVGFSAPSDASQATDRPERLLVFTRCHGGSLEERLARATAPPLAWAQRLTVAIDVARGLSFLHAAAAVDGEGAVIHGDVKTANVLLDDAPVLTARLCDFGLGRALKRADTTHVQTKSLNGSWGYIDPAYARTGKLAVGSDVFSFGVVLLELMTGLPAVTEGRDPCDLASLAAKHDFDARSLLDESLDCPIAVATVFAQLARDCLVDDRAKRICADTLYASLISRENTLPPALREIATAPAAVARSHPTARASPSYVSGTFASKLAEAKS